MSKITIKFEYNIPEKIDAYHLKKIDVINLLIEEKEKMRDYLTEKQEEINKSIDELIKGSNITEAENFLSEISTKNDDENFNFIGEGNQDCVNNLYLSYREIMKGLKALDLFYNNDLLEIEDEKLDLIRFELNKDIRHLNKLLKLEKSNLKLELKKLLKNNEYYEKDFYNILTKIKQKTPLRVV